MSSAPTTITVSTQTDLNAAITALDQQTAPGAYVIKLAGDITETASNQPAGIVAIDLAAGVSLTIEGDDHVLNGGGVAGGLAVLGGKVSIADLTIEDTVAQGGDGEKSGGGGAGLGGGLFVGPGGDVTIQNLQFINDTAVGGKGGPGGGGGGGGNSSLIYAPLGPKGSTGAAGSNGVDAETPFTYGGAGSLGSLGGAGGYGADGGDGGGGGDGGKGAAGTVGSSYTGGHAGGGGTGAAGGTGGPGGKGGGGGGGGKGGAGGDGTQPPTNFPHYGGAPTGGARGGPGGAGGLGGYGGGGGDGGDGGEGGKGGNAPPANTAVAGKVGGHGGSGGAGANGGVGGFGAGGGGGGNGGAGGDGGDGGMGGKGGTHVAHTGGNKVGGQTPLTAAAATITTYYPPGPGGNGGTGGNGGAGGNGGFGGFGGGGAGGGAGGAGGKGGAGGAGGTPGGSPYPTAAAGADGSSGAAGAGGAGGVGGFGGGLGAGNAGAGGGGLGAGGDIFVASGGVLVVEGGAMNGSATGGEAGGGGATAGQGYGGAIFLQDDQAITLAASTVGPPSNTGATGLSVYSDITDEKAHGGTGSGRVVISGAGVVTLWSASDYTGGTEIKSGDLVLNGADALGSGAVDFTNQSGATLTFNRIDNGVAATPTNTIEGFAAGDKMIIYGIATTATAYANGTLTLTGTDQGTQVSLALHIVGDYTASDFQTLTTTFPGGTGSTILTVDTAPPGTTFTFQGGDAGFSAASAWLDNYGRTGTPGTQATALFPNGGTMTGSGTVEEIDVSSAAAFAGSFVADKLKIGGGALALNSGLLTTRLATLADDAASTGALDLTGAGLLFHASGKVVDGGAGAGAIAVGPGATAKIDGSLTLGAISQGSGQLTLTGDGDNSLTASVSVSSALIVGLAASATQSAITLNNQATLTSGSAVIGDAAGSEGAVTLNIGLSAKYFAAYAPTWTVNGHLIVGGYGAGTLTENGNATVQSYPTVNVKGLIEIGEFAGSTGVVTMTTANLYAQSDLVVGDRGAGTLTGGYVNAAGDIDIGKNQGGVGVAIFNGGGLGTSTGELVVGGFGQGSLTMSNGAIGTARLTDVGAGAGGSGVVSLDHSRLDTQSLIVGGAGTGSFTASHFSSIYINGAIGGVHLLVGGKSTGALTIQSNSTLTVGSPVDLGATAAGQGTLIVDGVGSKLDATTAYGFSTHYSGALIDGDAGVGDLQVNNQAVALFAGDNILGVHSGAKGTLEVASGGAASFTAFLNIATSVGAQGTASVSGAASSLTVTGALNVGDFGAGEIDVLAGGHASVANLTGGANYAALGGGAQASGVVVVDGAGSLFAIASDLTLGVAGAATLTIRNGGELIDSGALFSGFAASATTKIDVLSGGSLSVGGTLWLAQDAGSTATMTVSGATVSATTLDVGASGGGAAKLTIQSGGLVTVTNAEIFAGDSLTLAGGTLATDPVTVDSGGAISGFGAITGDITNNGGIAASGGLLDLTGAVGGALTLGAGASLLLEKAVAAGATIGFAPGGGETLTLKDPAAFAASLITGFAASDRIDLVGLAYSGPSTVTLSGTPTLSLGGVNLVFASNDIGASFTLTSDNNGGTFITDNVPCYVAGTRIATPRGEVAVEDLKVGDEVTLAGGGTRPIVWIGHRRLDLARHSDPAAVRPIRIARDAFGEALPRRDLWLSPGHNIVYDGCLIPAGGLVNGVSVTQHDVASVDYWHVELDAHDVMLAEGLPAESYLDTGNRTAFVNGGAFLDAHPDFSARHWADTCLPLTPRGPALIAARTRLLARLSEQGCGLDNDADAHIWLHGRRIEPMRLGPARLAFVLPEGSRDIELRAKTFTPAHVQAESDDPRALGLCVRRLQIDGAEIDLATVSEGWRQPEPSLRWTAGATPLPDGARVVLIDLAGEGLYWRQTSLISILPKLPPCSRSTSP